MAGQMTLQRKLRAVGLFGLLVAIYFVTYSGQAVSTDELVMFDGAHSFFRNGSLELAYTSDLRPYTLEPGNNPVSLLDVEPMQAYVAAPLLWLAAQLPGIGLVQTTWLLNILVTALTAVVVFYYGVTLGYTDRTALVVALLFGLATMAWPYSRLFFREPLFTLFAFGCAFALERWRQRLERGRFHSGWLAVAALALVGALFAKEAALLLVPTLLVVALPGAVGRLANRRTVLIVVVPLALIVTAILLYRQLFPGARYSDILGRLKSIDLQYLWAALPAHLLSPGFSLWVFSPILLLGLPGAYLLLRGARIRPVLVGLMILVSIAVGYSVLLGPRWYSGTGWGPRYLLPITPFLALWLLPVVDALLDRRAPIWAQAIAVGITVQSVFIQIVGVIIPVKAFGTYLYQEGLALSPIEPRTIAPWQDGVWNLLYTPITVSAHQSGSPSPIAWVVNGSGVIVVPLCLVAAGIAIYALLTRCPSRRRFWLSAGAVALSAAIMLYGGLLTYYHDPRYIGNNPDVWPALWSVVDHLNAETRPGDAVLLNDGAYRDLVMNYYKRREPVYLMPIAPGERLDKDQPPEIVTDNPEERIHPYTSMLLARLALTTSRWWFLTELGPFSEKRLRPVEHFLVRHYFPSADVIDQPTVRLIRFAPVSAPQDWVPPWPAYQADADFGPARLVGYDLPLGTTIKPGAMLPVSLLWRHDVWPSDLAPFDYSINVSLIGPDGAAVAQRAKQPMGTFGPMTLWTNGGYYRDNHALEIPDNVPPGEYELWVLVFDWRNGKNLPLRSAGQPDDHILIARIHVAG